MPSGARGFGRCVLFACGGFGDGNARSGAGMGGCRVECVLYEEDHPTFADLHRIMDRHALVPAARRSLLVLGTEFAGSIRSASVPRLQLHFCGGSRGQAFSRNAG